MSGLRGTPVVSPEQALFVRPWRAMVVHITGEGRLFSLRRSDDVAARQTRHSLFTDEERW